MYRVFRFGHRPFDKCLHPSSFISHPFILKFYKLGYDALVSSFIPIGPIGLKPHLLINLLRAN